MSFETPVAFFVFNRPEHTARTFAEIARLRPRTLLVVADGPRADRPGEAERCAAVRAVTERVDWDCTVLRSYSDANLGCRRRVSGGLDWVFSHCEEAIVLEDDCLPHRSFFRFCAELLERYRDDERVMMISGDNFQPRPDRTPFSYYFSAYAHVWGWASWRRAWRHYDVDMKLWPTLRDAGGPFTDLGDGDSERYWRDVFDRTYSGEIDTWDYQWLFACRAQSGLTVIPERNLIANIGFGAGATHTAAESHLAELPTAALDFPLRHPPYVARDVDADRVAFRRVFHPAPPPRARAARRLGGSVASALRRVLGVGAAPGPALSRDPGASA